MLELMAEYPGISYPMIAVGWLIHERTNGQDSGQLRFPKLLRNNSLVSEKRTKWRTDKAKERVRKKSDGSPKEVSEKSDYKSKSKSKSNINSPFIPQGGNGHMGKKKRESANERYAREMAELRERAKLHDAKENP
jgi:hypothetical protein